MSTPPNDRGESAQLVPLTAGLLLGLGLLYLGFKVWTDSKILPPRPEIEERSVENTHFLEPLFLPCICQVKMMVCCSTLVAGIVVCVGVLSLLSQCLCQPPPPCRPYRGWGGYGW